MKTVLLIIAMALTAGQSKAAFLVEMDNSLLCADDPLQQNIIELVSHQTPFNEFDLEGVVTITFLVDDDGRIHIRHVSSGNIFLADHVLATLQNRQVNCDCVDAGVMYTMRLKYVQYS